MEWCGWEIGDLGGEDDWQVGDYMRIYAYIRPVNSRRRGFFERIFLRSPISFLSRQNPGSRLLALWDRSTRNHKSTNKAKPQPKQSPGYFSIFHRGEAAPPRPSTAIWKNSARLRILFRVLSASFCGFQKIPPRPSPTSLRCASAVH